MVSNFETFIVNTYGHEPSTQEYLNTIQNIAEIFQIKVLNTNLYKPVPGKDWRGKQDFGGNPLCCHLSPGIANLSFAF